MKRKIIILLILVLLPSLAISQEKINLKGKWDLGLNIGLINNTSEVYIDAGNVSTKINFQASISGMYWFNNEIALHTNIGFMAASVNNSTTALGYGQKTAAILPFYFGIKLSPDALSVAKNIRPFVTAMIGGVTGTGTDNIINNFAVTTSTYTKSVFSVKGGIGADGLLSKLFRLGIMIDYLYMPDFDKAVGTRKNYSGLDLSLTFGVMM